MSFESYMSATPEARTARGTFDHSPASLPPLPADADDAARARRRAGVAEVQRAIAASFDAAFLPAKQQMDALFAQTPQFIAFGQMPPLNLAQAQLATITQIVNLCRSYQGDAATLAGLGAPQLQAYLAPILDDATKAQATITKTGGAGMRPY